MTGVDWIAGPHVTHVMQASQTDFPQQSFDVVMSFNHLEHDPFWEESLLHNLPSLKDGGLFILRWATHESGKHGPEFDPTHQGGYYPKTLEEVVTFLQSNGLKILERSKDINPYIGMMANIVARKKQEQNVE
jgi:SAM-dependent methyltransferase